MMKPHLALISVVVRDYDEALRYYIGQLGFRLREDTAQAEGRRWVVVTPPDGTCGLLLARAKNDRERAAVGNQTGGRVSFFLQTDDFDRDFAAYGARGVRFIETPRVETYGKVAVFEDLYGNRWDLIQLNAS